MDPINLADLEAAVTEAEQGEASVEVFVQGVADRIAAAVAAALAGNNTAIAAANTAIAAEVVRIKASSAKMAAAIAA